MAPGLHAQNKAFQKTAAEPIVKNLQSRPFAPGSDREQQTPDSTAQTNSASSLSHNLSNISVMPPASASTQPIQMSIRDKWKEFSPDIDTASWGRNTTQKAGDHVPQRSPLTKVARLGTRIATYPIAAAQSTAQLGINKTVLAAHNLSGGRIPLTRQAQGQQKFQEKHDKESAWYKNPANAAEVAASTAATGKYGPIKSPTAFNLINPMNRKWWKD